MTTPRPFNGKLVKDSHKDLAVGVNSDDIENGVPGSFTDCALALACKRRPGVLSATFDRTVAFLEYETEVVKYVLPKPTIAALVTFDATKGLMLEGRFDLIAVPRSRTRRAVAARKVTLAARRAAGVPARPYKPRTVSARTNRINVAGVRHGSGHVPAGAGQPEVVVEPFVTRLPYADPYSTGQTRG